MKNKKGFTLVELVMALMIAGTFVGIIMSLYTGIKSADMRMSNKRLLLGEASDLMDKIHEAALNYTIDYEEYFNRTGLGYGIGNTGFTSYGNLGERYYCGSGFENINNSNRKYNIYRRSDSGGCLTGGNQKYGEYQFQHWKLATGDLNNKRNEFSNVRVGPVAVNPNTGLDYLYLINPDGTERYYFRRKYIGGNGGTGKNDNLYVMQMLRLRGFDAGTGHDFNTWGAYDGFIDTWACDYSQGYLCGGVTVSGRDGYFLPGSGDDGRVNITSDKVTVNDLKIDIYPNKDPYLVGNETGLVYDPYVKISFTMNLYDKPSNDEITMTTTLSFKNSYTRFSAIEYTGYIASGYSAEEE